MLDLIIYLFAFFCAKGLKGAKVAIRGPKEANGCLWVSKGPKGAFGGV